MNNDSVILQMLGIHKTFDSNKALDNVNFELNAREIHGLLGGNGAGKTTLMNVLYGLYRMDSGEVLLNGNKIDIHSPKDAIKHGICMVHQHFLQVSSYTVLENIVLGTDVRNKYTMNLETEELQIKEKFCKRFGIDVDLKASIEDLPMGTRQKVEILKALYRGAKVLILDEPTTNLTPQEVDDLFQSLRVMVNEGLSIVFITHKLREVLSVCDRISVLRNGRNIVTLKRDEASEDAFIRGMVGDDLDIKHSVFFSKGELGDEALEVGDKAVLRVENVNMIHKEGHSQLTNVNFEVFDREIFGIAGVAGNGQVELAEAVIGLLSITNGKIEVNGKIVTESSTGALLKSGLAYIPEDRLSDGYLPKSNVAQNLILGYQRRDTYNKKGFINWQTVFQSSSELITEYKIKTSGPEDTAGNLSGGNIQRVMIARAFSHPARLLVAHNPTRGLDIPSMDFVYTKILERKKLGLTTLLISEDLDELILMCNRIGVLYRGEIVGIIDRNRFEKYEIGRMMAGYQSAEKNIS